MAGYVAAWRRRVWLGLAGALGTLLGMLLTGSREVARIIPGVLGALLVSYGLFEAWRPLGLVAAGLFLIAADRYVR